MKELRSIMDEGRRVILEGFCDALQNPEGMRDCWDEYLPHLKSIKALEVFYLVHHLMETHEDLQESKVLVSRLIHSVSNHLVYDPSLYEESPFLTRVQEENAQIEELMNDLKTSLKEINAVYAEETAVSIRKGLQQLSILLRDHYEKMENLVFPLIEKEIDEHECTALMWSIHIDAYTALGRCLDYLDSFSIFKRQFNEQTGKLFFAVNTIILREVRILFPGMFELLPISVWDRLESYYQEEGLHIEASYDHDTIDLPTGNLSKDQLIQLFSNLPVDVTLVDRDDRVVFYNTPPHRFFPRTPAVIGRKVQQCHPPKSIDIVERILSAFREKRHTRAEFRLHIHDKFLLITYTALYDEHGAYDGVLEVLQDISGIQAMEGDKRLLDWTD